MSLTQKQEDDPRAILAKGWVGRDFSALLLAPLCHAPPVVRPYAQFPCFGAIVFTFLEKPFLDFSFSLGKLDVMSIGPGEASVGAAVSNMIRNILNGMMVFPKKMVIPILPEQDVLVSQH